MSQRIEPFKILVGNFSLILCDFRLFRKYFNHLMGLKFQVERKVERVRMRGTGQCILSLAFLSNRPIAFRSRRALSRVGHYRLSLYWNRSITLRLNLRLEHPFVADDTSESLDPHERSHEHTPTCSHPSLTSTIDRFDVQRCQRDTPVMLMRRYMRYNISQNLFLGKDTYM